jgi:hypothetical protein
MDCSQLLDGFCGGRVLLRGPEPLDEHLDEVVGLLARVPIAVKDLNEIVVILLVLLILEIEVMEGLRGYKAIAMAGAADIAM